MMVTQDSDDHTSLDSRRDDIFNNILNHFTEQELLKIAQGILVYKLSDELLQFIYENEECNEFKRLQGKAERKK